MSLPQDSGRYKGHPVEWTVDEQGSNNLPTFVCRFSLEQYLIGQEWQPAEMGLEITAYVFLFKKDGQPNDFAIKSLNDSIGWDGKSFAGLANSDWSQTEVQLTVGEEEYNGKRQMKVQFINAADWSGGIKKADQQQIVSLDQRYGAMLRAVAGKNGNGKATAAPTTPPRPQAQTVKPRKAAWDIFTQINPGKTVDELSPLWKAEVSSLMPGKTQTEMSDGDWVEVAKKLRAPKVPAGDMPLDEEEFKEDDIPF